MDKRTRLERTIAGEATDRPPVALWRHFPGDDLRAGDHARSLIEYQRAYDWDVLVGLPCASSIATDYGLLDAWEGRADGVRTVHKHPIQRSIDWTTLRVLDPLRGGSGRYLETLDQVTRGLGDAVPVCAAVFSPLAHAAMMAGDTLLLRHLRTEPERLRTALNTLTENILRLIDVLKRLPLAGLHYIVEHASITRFSEDEYAAFGLPSDLKILEALPQKWWLNSVNLRGDLPMFKFAAGMPVQVVQWADRDTEPELNIGKTLISGAVCGGLAGAAHVLNGTPATIRDVVHDAIHRTAGRRLILSCGGAAPVIAPLSNYRAVREAVEG
ncbi:MAG: hypothetical protein KME04_03605 [Pleurocapsa minor GSE-CHR-MK-17-07R]|jgi:uroporphyrinogen decarboxylase|nr:hypothetical protein [Pleurocapsa minor GSE-CHR-MK 17-07R]